MDETDARHDEACTLFRKVLGDRGVILVSRRHVMEMKSTGYLNEFKLLRDGMWRIWECVQVADEELDRQLALRHQEYFQVGFGDCLHLVLAMKNGATACSYDGHWHVVGRELGTRVCYPRDLL